MGAQTDVGRRASALRWGAVLAAMLVSLGCTIIVEPPDAAPSAPIFVPFTCLPVAVDPASGERELVSEAPPTAHVVFAARIQRSTANLAAVYERFMEETVAGLAALGLHVTHAALVGLEERPHPGLLAAWGCELEQPAQLPPSTVVRFHAAAPALPAEPLGCALDPLMDVGRRMSTLSTNYPPGLDGRSGQAVFGAAPDVLVVAYLDPLARRTSFDEPRCQAATSSLLEQSAGGRAEWLAYEGGGPPVGRVAHWLVHTDEGVDDVALAERCRGVDGFPLGLLDALESSPRRLYTPMAEILREAGGRTQALSMCAFMSGERRLDFLVRGLSELAQALDRPVNAEVLLTLLQQASVRGLGED